MFFTRLPLWRLVEVPAESYKRVVELWPLAGWLTGGVAALILWGASLALPLTAAVILAYAGRLLLTGALHEDGLADFCDGIGGGTTRERTLAIMKDSHIGTYGVLGLVVYYLLLVTLVSQAAMPVEELCLTVLAADCWSKFCAAQIINVLPYARTEATAKNRTVYERMGVGGFLTAFIFGVVPSAWLIWDTGCHRLIFAMAASALVAALLFWLMHRRLRGYTGDCCGTTFLLCELAYWLVIG